MVQELPNIESIFDFLYLDNTKIKSFYAQLTRQGSLTTIKENHGLQTTESKEATVGVPTITGGKLSNLQTTNRGDERLYDGIPTMPREMIDKLDELGFIERELSAENVGKLVLLQGKLNITDVDTLKNLIEPSLKLDTIQRSKSASSKQKQAIRQSSDENKILVELIKAIPYALEATLFVNDQSVWMTLNRNEMVGNPHDINLKHGNILFGEYYVLGVLDAIPYDDEMPSVNDEWRLALLTIVAELKNTMGRRTNHYGITPIAIFRVIKTNK